MKNNLVVVFKIINDEIESFMNDEKKNRRGDFFSRR